MVRLIRLFGSGSWLVWFEVAGLIVGMVCKVSTNYVTITALGIGILVGILAKF